MVTLNSNNWCTEFGVTAPPPPIVANVTPSTVMLGRPFQLQVTGSNLGAGGTPHVVINGTSMDANVVVLDPDDLIVVVPTDTVNRSTTGDDGRHSNRWRPYRSQG